MCYMGWENFANIPTVFTRPDGVFYFILFYFILLYFILFYFILFYFILFYFILLSSLLLSSSTRRRYYPQRSCGQDVVTGVVPSPPP